MQQNDPNQLQVKTTNDAVDGGAVQNPREKRHWFIAIVGTNREKAIRDQLNAQGYETYVASQQELRYWRNGRRKMVEVVKISHTLFIYATEAERDHILRTNGTIIRYFLMDRSLADTGTKKFAMIPDKEMHMFQLMLAQSEAAVEFSVSPLCLGDKVRVVHGNLCGFEGQVVRINGTEVHHIGIRIGQLGCAMVQVSQNDIIKIS